MVTAATEPGRKVRPNTQFARVNTASFQGERGDATLRTASDLTIKPGVQLAEGCFIGKQLGKGIQGEVYELLNERSEPMSLVLKTIPQGAVSAVAGILPSMEREWAVGHRLALYCTTPTGDLHPGFMKVGAALIAESRRTESTNKRIRRQLKLDTKSAKKDLNKPGSNRRLNGQFRGMILERLSGKTLDEELAARRARVQDVHFLREVLYQVLTALAAAQGLGFRHWDLRLSNIMEHRGPEHYRTYPITQTAARHDSASVDMPLSPSTGANGSCDMSYASTASVDSGPDENADSGDYENFGKENAASAGHEDEWTDIQLQASGDLAKTLEQTAPPAKKPPLRKKLGGKSRRKVLPGGKLAERDAPTSGDAAQPEQESRPLVPQYKIIDYGHADFGDATLQDDGMAMEGPYFDPQDGLPKWMLRKGLPGIPPAERCYRAFWWRKGDVFRLLMSLQNVIDGCTWPKQDERAVQQLQGLIHHVTGKKIEVYFTSAEATDKVALTCGPSAWRRSDGWLHGARKAFVRAQSFVIPYNPGITAGEALALPFFNSGRAQGS